MRLFIPVLAVTALLLPLSAADAGKTVASVPATAPTPLSFAPMIKAVAPSVVTVYSSKNAKAPELPEGMDPDEFFRFFGGAPGGAPDGQRARGRKQQGLGSGVIVSAEGYILTNNHVVDGADEIKVRISEHSAELTAKVVGTDPKTDLAVVKIDAKGLTLPVATFADSAKAQVGDLVFAIGNPFGVGQTVTMGIISATGRGGVGIVDYEDFLQTDASINPGNSGGALVDSTGHVLGINTAILSPSGGNLGIGFAVPANLARSIMESIISGGKVVRGYLGVMIQPVTSELAKSLKLPSEDGALIGDVNDGGPAAKAGLKAGDVIVQVDGQAISDPRQLRLLIASHKPGATVKLTVLRDGAEKKFDAILKDLPTEDEVAKGDSSDAAASGKNVGVRLEELDGQSRRRFQIPAKIEGALIVEVKPDSRAARAGLRPGDVITEIDKQDVAAADEAVKRLRAADGELLLRVYSRGGNRYVVVPAPE